MHNFLTHHIFIYIHHVLIYIFFIKCKKLWTCTFCFMQGKFSEEIDVATLDHNIKSISLYSNAISLSIKIEI